MGFADYNDDFAGDNGSAINSDKWTVSGSPDIQSNAAELTNAETIESKWSFTGDFDVQVDFALQSPPSADSFNTNLRFLIDSTHALYIGAARYSGGRYYQLGWCNGGAYSYAAASRSSDTGKLRIKRVGNQITAYYQNGSGETYILDGTKTVGSAGNSGAIKIYQGRWDTNPNITVRWDNFTIVSDGTVAAYSPDASDVLTGGTASAISSYSVYTPAKACDDGTTPWMTGSITPPNTYWWQYDLGAGVSKKVVTLHIMAATIRGISKSFTLYGSNTGSFSGEETNVFSVSGLFWLVDEMKKWSFSNANSFRYYRIVFGGVAAEYYPNLTEIEMLEGQTYTDPSASGGIVFGSLGDLSTPENNQIDGVASGGIVFGGYSTEQWSTEPNNSVAVKGGLYRISGVLFTLSNTMSIEGLGSISALVNCAAAPTGVGAYRYDLLSIDAAGDITVTAGTAATVPVMPVTPASSVKLNHILRYYGQTSIIQSDIGKTWLAPALTTLTAVIADDELAWAELSTTITITCRDQYGQLFTGSKTVNAAFETGNGTIAPLLRSGGGSSFVFTYTRGGNDPGDISPMLTFSSATGALCVAFITLLDAGGAIMI